jgi:hypothetical protein
MVDIGRTGIEAPADRNRLGADPSLTSLVSGIVNDVQELSRQQLALFKAEITSDLRKTRTVAVSWSIGLAVATVGGLMLCLMLVHLINWAFDWPQWAGYAIVGGVGVAVGAALFYAGKKKLDSFSLVPSESIHALKENVQCLTTRT